MTSLFHFRRRTSSRTQAAFSSSLPSTRFTACAGQDSLRAWPGRSRDPQVLGLPCSHVRCTKRQRLTRWLCARSRHTGAQRLELLRRARLRQLPCLRILGACSPCRPRRRPQHLLLSPHCNRHARIAVLPHHRHHKARFFVWSRHGRIRLGCRQRHWCSARYALPHWVAPDSGMHATSAPCHPATTPRLTSRWFRWLAFHMYPRQQLRILAMTGMACLRTTMKQCPLRALRRRVRSTQCHQAMATNMNPASTMIPYDR